MTDRKPCIRCAREIDGYARICPFCNWDQSETPPAETYDAAAQVGYTPPKDRRVQRKLLMIGGGVALLIASFLIGALIHGSDPRVDEETQADGAAADQVKPPKRADVTLVPLTSGDFETPITSAPLTTTAAGTPTEYQRSDATAVSSDEYALLAARVKEERRKAKAAVDPRSLSGAAYEPSNPRPEQTAPATEPPAEAGATSSDDRPFDREMPTAGLTTRTRPVPEYQPLPNIRVSERTTARLDLVIGADGRVKEVTVREPIPGETAKLIAAVQSWRFKPATENGQPVSSPYSVDLTFNGNE